MTEWASLMSLSAIMQSAATEAQSRLAEIGGAESGVKNSLYNGAKYLAVYGLPIVVRVMLSSGGYRQRTIVPTSVTRGQFSAPLVANQKWVRTDMDPNLIYLIEKVDLHDSLVYVLTLVRVGE